MVRAFTLGDAVVMIQARRSRKVEKLARIYDAEIAPCWGTRFARMLLRNLVVPVRGQVLDVSCGTGAPAIEILRRMSDGARLIAIDESSAMLDVVRRKVAALGPLAGKAFFRTESALPRLSFADDVYDLVVCNLGLGEMPSSEAALCDFARVAKPGGEVRATLPLAGTFEEFHDLYREVLFKHDKHDALDRLAVHVARYPASDRAEAWLAAAGLTGRIEIEEFQLLFRSAREFFFAPVIEYGPLAAWKQIAGGAQEMQDVFWYIKEAIDAYFGDRPFHVTVKAGLVVGSKPERVVVASAGGPAEVARLAELTESDDAAGADCITQPVPLTDAATATGGEDSFDHIATGLPWPPRDIADGSVVVKDEPADDPEVQELASGEYLLEEDSRAELDLEAFIAGRKRPHHLTD